MRTKQNAGATKKADKNANAKASTKSKATTPNAEVDNLNVSGNTRGVMLHPETDGRKANGAGRAGKYKYPEDVKTAADRKAFRRKARAALRNFDEQILGLKGKRNEEDVKQRDKLTKEMNKFIKDTYEDGVPLVIDVKEEHAEHV